MGQSLAVKHRPTDFNNVVGQKSTVELLKAMLESGDIKHAYLFCGHTGTGKTTLARISANFINHNQGSAIELDAASNSSVENVRKIIQDAQERSIDSKYKIYIIDEAHALSNAAWQAFLKCLEEPPEYTIFIFCTTDPQKIPATILNRVYRFNFSKVSVKDIEARLLHICAEEHFSNYKETCAYIARICDGSVRNAITMLEKCSMLDKNLDIKSCIEILGNYSYDIYFKLINDMIDGKEDQVLQVISDLYDDGQDMKIFTDQYLSFCIDINKYALFKNLDAIKIPEYYKQELDRTIAIEGARNYFYYILDELLKLKLDMKSETNIESLISVRFLKMTRCK